MPSFDQNTYATPVVSATLSKEAAVTLLQGESASYEQIISGEKDAPFELTSNKKVQFQIAIQEETVFTRNVVAILPGSHPKLKSEYVAIGSHYDHVGVANSIAKDRIFNGADDDGSGTVAMLEFANALAQGPRPKRSTIFVWHAGEEKGLWGSDHFTKNPTVPIQSIVAQLNLDMIGRSKPVGNQDSRNQMLTGPDDIYVIGSRRLSQQLGNLVARVNQNLYKLNYNYHYDKPNDPENLYERSDHYNYARFNIPIAFFFDGVHEDYHQVGDEVQKIDFRKLERVSRTVCETAWTIANLSNRPALDKKDSVPSTSQKRQRAQG
jgi:Zn-dependent M28 family amino/carboxypeptidase